MTKLFVTTIALVSMNLIVSAQGVEITSGGYIVASGSANIVVNNGSLLNNGAYNKGTETLSFTGSTAGTISGSSNTSVNHLVISNTSGITTSLALLTAQTLDISASCNLTVAAAKELTVNGTITNSGGTGGLVLKSTAAGTASLIHSTSSVPATVERYIPSSAESWHFMATPVAAQNISGDWIPSGPYGNGTGYDLYAWKESTSCWIYQPGTSWSSVHSESYFVPGRGYLYAFYATNPTKTFTGNLNNGSINVSLGFSSTNETLKGFNFVGNPYPSPIDWSASEGWSRSTLAASGGGYDMWIWNPTVSNYGVYNSADGDGVGTNSVTRYIASTQGFFVKSASNGTLGLDNSVRVHDGSGNVFKAKVQKRDVVSLTVKSEAGMGADEVMLRFGHTQNASGATKLFSRVETAPSLYMSTGSENLSIRYLTTPEQNASVPVMFTPGYSGTYSISSEFDQLRFSLLKLEDKQAHTIYDLTSGRPYSFKASKGDSPNRFVLHFAPELPDSKVQLPAQVYSFDRKLVVDLELVGGETDVEVYDLLGRKVMQRKVPGEVKHRLDLDAKTGVVIVVLRNRDKVLGQKVMWVRE